MLSPEQAQGLAIMLLQGIENEFQTTKKVLAALPENQLDFKLGDKGRTARELAWHIVTADIWFGEGVTNGQFATEGEPPAAATVAEMVAIYDQKIPGLIEKARKLSGAQLSQPINFMNVFNLPAVLYIQFWNNHSIHHRGQLSTYLRAMNAHVPSIYGGSADEPFEMPAGAS